jgi:hypothetical protein
MIVSKGFIVQDKEGLVIYGIGKTIDDAWAEVVTGVGSFLDACGNAIAPQIARETQFSTYPATSALIAEVKAKGGAISWEIVENIACTCKEAQLNQKSKKGNSEIEPKLTGYNPMNRSGNL